ncbi:MAG TPA: DMT family transporter, partial [Egibacteraceae bacterium]|nr:DMT family transporter [Egibacteraceae bacterium]
VLAVSTSSILIRVADAPSLSLAFWRCFAGAVVLAPFAARARRRGGPLDGTQRRQLLGAGVFLAAHFAAFISSLSFTTVASAAVLVTTAPLFVGIGAAVFLSEPPSRKTWAGIALAILGAAGIALADLEGLEGGDALIGDALAFAGAALVAGYLLLGRAARRTLPVSRYAAGVYGVAAAVLLPVTVATGAALWGYSAGTWLAIAGLVIGPQLLGHTIFNSLLVAVAPTVIAVVVLAEPVGSTILAFWLLDESPTPGFWLAAPLIAVGVWLAVVGARSPVDTDVASPQ